MLLIIYNLFIITVILMLALRCVIAFFDFGTQLGVKIQIKHTLNLVAALQYSQQTVVEIPKTKNDREDHKTHTNNRCRGKQALNQVTNRLADAFFGLHVYEGGFKMQLDSESRNIPRSSNTISLMLRINNPQRKKSQDGNSNQNENSTSLNYF